MPQSKEQHREYMKQKRLKGSQEKVHKTEGSQKGSQCPETVILSDGQIWHPDARYWRPKVEKKESDYPAVVQAVVNKREKMEAITRELKAHNVSDIVRYGIEGPTFDVVGEILDCVK